MSKVSGKDTDTGYLICCRSSRRATDFLWQTTLVPTPKDLATWHAEIPILGMNFFSLTTLASSTIPESLVEPPVLGAARHPCLMLPLLLYIPQLDNIAYCNYVHQYI